MYIMLSEGAQIPAERWDEKNVRISHPDVAELKKFDEWFSSLSMPACRCKKLPHFVCRAAQILLVSVAAGNFRNCVSPVPLRHFYAIFAWGCVGK